MLQKWGPQVEHPPSPRLRRDGELCEEKSWGISGNLTTMTDSLHSHNSNHNRDLVKDAVITKANSPVVLGSGEFATAGLRSGRHRSLLAKMPKPNAKKRRVRVKGVASRGLGRVWKK